MPKINRHIEIVRSSIRGLSSMSQLSCENIYGVLAKNYSRVEVTIIDNFKDLCALKTRRPDLIFSGMEFIVEDVLGKNSPRKIWLSDFFEENDIPYTGSGRTALELGRNKTLAKEHVKMAGIRTPGYCLVPRELAFDLSDLELRFPLFVKPANRGGGFGIDSNSVVRNSYQLQKRVAWVTTRLGCDALIEEYLPGREFSAALLRLEDSNEIEVMPIELIAPIDNMGARLLSGKVKSANSEKAFALTDKVLKAKIISHALEVFSALGANDYGRIDLRLDRSGEPSFLEANLLPSLISGYGSFPKACHVNAALEFEPMILRIADLAIPSEKIRLSDASVLNPLFCEEASALAV